MPFLGIGKGQTELIQRGERTSPIVIIGQGLALVAVTLFGFAVVRIYWHFWNWITRNEAHGWFMPPAIILLAGCVIVDIVLYMEINDPNWPPTRNPTDSTRPLHPMSRERRTPPTPTTNVNVKIGFAEALQTLLDSLEVEADDDELE